MATIRCPQCGKRTDAGEPTCPRCGAVVPPPIELAESESHGRGESRLTTCPDCGREVSRRAPACPHCGAPIAAGPIRSGKRDWGFEWTSQAHVGSWPLVHVAIGRKNGKLLTAKGVVAVGQFARGAFVVAQFGWALVFGFGQFIAAPVAIGQFALALFFALGQFAGGYVAIGQMAIGGYVLAQVGYGYFAWTSYGRDPEAVRFFTQFWNLLIGR